MANFNHVMVRVCVYVCVYFRIEKRIIYLVIELQEKCISNYLPKLLWLLMRHLYYSLSLPAGLFSV